MAQVRAQEAQELQEDVQALARESKYVKAEYSKSAQANEALRKHNDELADRERHAQQALRALEIEKQDILSNYRGACQENERLQESLQSMSAEQQSLYAQL